MGKESYFAGQAEMYSENLDKGFLGIVRRVEKKVVLRFLDPKERESILDIPCGSGYYAKFIQQKKAKVYGVDMSKAMMKQFKKKGYKGEVGNLESFSLEKRFDKVLSAGGFEFCRNHKQIIENLVQHTKEQGKIVILLPRKSFFGFLYKIYHRICNNITITLFSRKDVLRLCNAKVVRMVKIKKCSLFSFVITLQKRSVENEKTKTNSKSY